MVTRKAKLLRDRIKDLKRGKHKKQVIENLSKEDNIKEIKSRIKMCEHDLKVNFPNNTVIEHKLKGLKEQLRLLKK